MVAIKSISRILAVLLIALVFVDFALAASVSVDSFNPGADSWVSALAVQPDGKILVGGYFSQLGGAARSYIGRLNADGSLDTSFTPSANDIVISLAIQPDGKILVGGAFTTLNGITRNKIGRLNADGTLDTSFNPGANGSIHTFTLQPDGKILVGGEFTTLGGSARSKLGRLNSDGSLDTSFNPGASMTNINQAVVYVMAVQSDGKILVGGEFTVLGGGARYRIGRLDANGSLDTSFNTTTYFSTVTGLIVQPDGKILVGGGAINRLNADGSVDSSFSAGTNNINSASMGLQLDGKIILGGFSGATHYVKWLNSNGSLDTNFDPGSASYIRSLTIQQDGKLLLGGNFALLNGISRNNIGRLSNGTSASVQNIISNSDGTTLEWQRSGAGPEVSYGTFELSTDGVGYTLLGVGARINGGWQLTGLTLPKEQNLFIRARGYYGSGTSSGSVVEYVDNIYISHIPLTLTVTKIADTNDGVCDNDCSLREAIAVSATGDTINFDSLLSGESITLGSTLNINKNLTIDGSALALKITISGNNNVPVFEVSSSITTTLTSLIISKGKSGDYGGGIRNLGTLYLLNSIVSDNSAIESGGGIHNLGRLNIANSTISNNSSYFGGGVLNLGESLQIANTTIVGNSATEGGGIHNASALSLSNSTVSNNSARGGGIISIGTMNIANSTFSGNSSSEEGGGILNYGPLTITNSTFSGNSAVTWGGGIYNGNGPLNLTNTIISNSTAGGDCYNDNTISATMGVNINNLVEANAASPNNCGTPAFISDPKLGVLSNNGDLTQTMPLGAGSPAIDTGNDANCPATDQRGMRRPQGSHCDIGAYEYRHLIYYVKSNAGGANNGTSWTNAYTDLQSALSTSLFGDEIWVAAGTYKPTTNTDRAVSFVLKNGVEIYGGFNGAETLRAQRYPAGNVTILSGDIGVIGDSSDNSYHVITADNINTAVLDGFTVMDGYANATYPYDSGGGLYNNSSSLALKNLIFNKNFAQHGGGMYNEGVSNPTLDVVTFRNNSVYSGNGGGMNNFNSSPTLTDVTFDGNSAIYGNGGGLYNDGGNPILTKVTFINNSGGQGGGMFNGNSSNSNLTNVIFNSNSAVNGGGMTNISSNPSLTNITFTNNSVSAYSGESYGGGLSNQSSSPSLTNVTFNTNSANYGGGIWNNFSNPILSNVTFTGNLATLGGGISNWLGSNPIIKNTILWGDTGGEIVNILGGSFVVTYSIVQGGYAGSGNLNADPLLAPLSNNGGFTQTMALGAGSPAINAGTDTGCPATDQRGVARPQGSHCDIGAYEAFTLAATSKWTGDFSYAQGWRTDLHPRTNGDVNGDGKDDLVGFGYGGIFVSLSNGTQFLPVSKWSGDYSYDQGWRIELHPRMVGDVNGDGKEDVVGYGTGGAWVALSDGTKFLAVSKWTSDFSYAQGWRTDLHPRAVGDMNGDGKDDLIGFGYGGIFVALSDGTKFLPVAKWSGDYSYDQGWRIELHPRMVGDVNGDGKDDVVGYGTGGVWVALSDGSKFLTVTKWTDDFSYAQGWRTDLHPRVVGDMNGDGKDDLIGFGYGGIFVSLSDGAKFLPVSKWSGDYSYDQGWRIELHPRMVGDVNGDLKEDVVGYGTGGAWIALAQ